MPDKKQITEERSTSELMTDPNILELTLAARDFRRWRGGKAFEKRALLSHFHDVSSNLIGSAEAILSLIFNGDRSRQKLIPYYIKGINSYMELMDSNPRFKNAELMSQGGYFPDIDDGGNPRYGNLNVGGSCYYVLEAKKRFDILEGDKNLKASSQELLYQILKSSALPGLPCFRDFQ
jgi:hypothetical protein